MKQFEERSILDAERVLEELFASKDAHSPFLKI
jgi:hypothetical protein